VGITTRLRDLPNAEAICRLDQSLPELGAARNDFGYQGNMARPPSQSIARGALIVGSLVFATGVVGAIVSVAFHAPATGAGVAVGLLALVVGLVGSFSLMRKVKAEYGPGRRPDSHSSL
jgi:hypothetical protein